MRRVILLTATLLSSVASASAGQLDVWGRWYTPDHASMVEISDCGDGTPCGVVLWVDEHDGMTVDANNPNPNLQGRPMIGVKLLHSFEPKSHRWGSGAIYNPENGRTYRARMALESENTLAVSGCLGPICKKLLWERADTDVASATQPATTGEAELASLD